MTGPPLLTDLAAAQTFVEDRLTARDSAIFIATHDTDCVGFTQLYPSFSSVVMKRIWILNDLFVTESARRHGVASHLLGAALDFARETDATRLVLATAVDNREAHSLYHKHGWQLDTNFNHYVLAASGG